MTRIITAEAAINAGISAHEMHQIATWHEVRAITGFSHDAPRHEAISRKVRAVAFQISDLNA